ncbi:MAG: phosphatidylglycerophosphatase A [Thermodesulfobacteria bacterium]|nr:phosphatidylglycerophosphatase A [Thermodesulfobacteriota bacterium]
MFKNFIWVFISSWALIGFLPPCPGTWATLEAVLMFWFFRDLSILNQLLIVAGVTLVGIISSHLTSKILREKDPDLVVIDEVAGVWLGLVGKLHAWEFVFGFIIFRAIDILKPFPIKRFEKLPGGFGIMIDDLIAGIFTNLILLALLYLKLHYIK